MKKRWMSVCMVICMMLTEVFGLADVQAAERVVVEAKSKVLQEGGLLSKRKLSKASATRSVDVDAASEAIMKGLEEFQEEIDLSEYQIPTSDIAQIYWDILNNHPTYFYVRSRFSYAHDSNGVLYVIPQYVDTEDKVEKMKIEYEARISEILADIDSSWSDFEKALYINDYICTHTEYDTTYEKHNSYNVLVEGTAVCQGYALAYQDLCDRMGIESAVVTSESLDHAWNMVEVDDQCYFVDSTWNDPVADRLGRARHYYFLKSNAYFQSDEGNHAASDYVFSKEYSMNDASSTAFDAAEWTESDNPFHYYKGYWYANVDNKLQKYQGSNSGMEEMDIIKTFTDKWYVWESDSSFWSAKYNGGILYNRLFIYATPKKLVSLNLENNTEQDVYSLTEEEEKMGYIYGFCIDKNGEIRYCIATSPNSTDIENGTIKSTELCKHDYSDWEVTEEASCTRAGERWRECSNCGNKERGSIAATGHKHTKIEKKAASFVSKGYEKTICLDCGTVVKNKSIAKISCKKGSVYTVGNYKYKIINNAVNGKGTVAFAGLAKSVTKVSVGSTITIKGAKFTIVEISSKALKNKTKVTSVTIGKNIKTIGSEAFSGCKKLKTISISSAKLTKVGSKAFKNIYAKAKIKVPKSKLSKYKKLLKGKGQKSTVKITKL